MKKYLIIIVIFYTYVSSIAAMHVAHPAMLQLQCKLTETKTQLFDFSWELAQKCITLKHMLDDISSTNDQDGDCLDPIPIEFLSSLDDSIKTMGDFQLLGEMLVKSESKKIDAALHHLKSNRLYNLIALADYLDFEQMVDRCFDKSIEDMKTSPMELLTIKNPAITSAIERIFLQKKLNFFRYAHNLWLMKNSTMCTSELLVQHHKGSSASPLHGFVFGLVWDSENVFKYLRGGQYRQVSHLYTYNLNKTTNAEILSDQPIKTPHQLVDPMNVSWSPKKTKYVVSFVNRLKIYHPNQSFSKKQTIYMGKKYWFRLSAWNPKDNDEIAFLCNPKDNKEESIINILKKESAKNDAQFEQKLSALFYQDIGTFSWDPKGKSIAACTDKLIYILDNLESVSTLTYERIQVPGMEQDPHSLKSSIAWSPNASEIAVSVGNTIFLYERSTKQFRKKLKISNLIVDNIQNISWSNDSRYLAGVNPQRIRVWDSVLGTELAKIEDDDCKESYHEIVWHPIDPIFLYVYSKNIDNEAYLRFKKFEIKKNINLETQCAQFDTFNHLARIAACYHAYTTAQLEKYPALMDDAYTFPSEVQACLKLPKRYNIPVSEAFTSSPT